MADYERCGFVLEPFEHYPTGVHWVRISRSVGDPDRIVLDAKISAYMRAGDVWALYHHASDEEFTKAMNRLVVVAEIPSDAAKEADR